MSYQLPRSYSYDTNWHSRIKKSNGHRTVKSLLKLGLIYGSIAGLITLHYLGYI